MISRRTFLPGTSAVLLAAPLAAEARQAGKVSRIGVLLNLYPPDADPPQALRQGLRNLGYVEGQNLVIDWRYQLVKSQVGMGSTSTFTLPVRS